MSAASFDGATAMVTGASGGFGRAISASLAAAGAHVIGIGRNEERMRPLQAELGSAFAAAIGDACDPTFVAELIDAHEPTLLVLNAGASTHNRPIQQQTWQSFSRNWDVDTQHVFHWTREALLRPLPAGSTVVAISSGRRCAARPSAAATQGPRRRSGSSPSTPPARQTGPGLASASCRSSPTSRRQRDSVPRPSPHTPTALESTATRSARRADRPCRRRRSVPPSSS